MLVRAYCDIDRAGEQGIERFPAAFEIAHCDGKSVVAEMAAPLRDRHRQVIEMRLVGDAKLERGAFEPLPMGQIERDPAEQQGCHTRGEDPTVILQFYHGATKELQCLASIAPFRPSWQSQIPAMPKAPDIDQPYALHPGLGRVSDPAPTRRTRSPYCACAASGHAAAPPSSVMNSRLFIR